MACNPTLFNQARKGLSSAPSGWDVSFDRFLGLKPQAQSYSPFRTKIGQSASLIRDRREDKALVFGLDSRKLPNTCCSRRPAGEFRF
jgi:hypothetical protein